MRILVVNTADVGGGAETIARQLWEGYRAAGHDAWLAVGHRRGPPREGLVEIPRHNARNLWARTLYRAAETQLDPGTARRLELAGKLGEPLRMLRKQLGHEDMAFPGSHVLLQWARHVDVVHLHNLHGDYFDLRILPALFRVAPTVLTLHDEWLLTGHCASTQGCARFGHGCGACPDLQRFPSVHQDATRENRERKGSLVNGSRAVTSPGRWLLERAQRAGMQAEAFVHTPHGVDGGVFHPDRARARVELGIAPGARVVTYDVTHTRAVRRPAWARAAAAHLPAGSVVLEMGTAAERPPQMPGVEVRALGPLDARGVARALQAADVYLHPTVADTHPTAVLEALACGAFVVASAVDGIPEMLTAPRAGRAIHADPSGWAAALEALPPPGRVAPLAGSTPKLADMVRGYLEALAGAAENWAGLPPPRHG